MGWGFHDLNTYASDPQPWITLGKQFWGPGFLVIFFALVNSGIAGGSTATTYSSRVLLAMGRSGVLPRPLARIHPEHRTPHVAVAVEALISIFGGLILGALWGYGSGLGVAYTTMGASLVVGYIGLCLGTIAHYSTRARSEFNPFFHALLPVLGIGILVFFTILALFPTLLVGPLQTATTATGPRLAPPQPGYPLGTDELGRSIANLTVHGARISMVIGLLATLVTVFIGVLIGIVRVVDLGLYFHRPSPSRSYACSFSQAGLTSDRRAR